MNKEDSENIPLLPPRIFHPWFYFWIFLSSNILLSYFSFSFSIRLWVGFLGLIIPFSIALWTVLKIRWKSKSMMPYSLSFPDFPFTHNILSPWLWFSFAFFLLFSRFYKLTTVPFWPISDEGTFAMFAMSLQKKWNWSLLWGEFRMEPLLTWSLGEFFRIFGPSFTTLRLFTALLSILAAALAYWAARQFFPKFFSFVFCWLFSFSFWEFSLMRFCHPNDLIPIFELLTFGLLGGLTKSKHNSSKWGWILALGLCCGIGFYAYVNWVVVWFFVTLVLFAYGFNSETRNLKFFAAFEFVTVFLAFSLFISRFAPGAMSNINNDFGGFFSAKSWILYFSGLFWESKASYPFGPDWGGMLNPIMGSLVFMGTLRLAEKFEKTLWAWMGLGLFLTMLPGVISNYLELHRTTPALPFWILLATLGVQSLISHGVQITSSRGWIVCLLLGSLALNIYNFFGPYSDIKRSLPYRQWRSVEYWNAYQILRSQAEQSGPLYVFSEFNNDYDDKTLLVADYPLDALQNPDLSHIQPHWVALLCNINYAPFLQKRFPGLKAILLNSNLPPQDLHHSLGLLLIPEEEIPPQTLNQWIRAHEVYRKVSLEVKNKSPLTSWEQFVGPMAPIQNLSKGDPYLESVYWEKSASFQVMAGDFPAAAQSFQKALQEGYPLDHFRHNLARARQLAESKKNI